MAALCSCQSVRPSVCLSVCPVRAPNSKTKRQKNQNCCERSQGQE